MIEGDAAAIDSLFERLLVDDRHLAVSLLSRVEVADRLFPQWAMLHDPARSWLWSADEVGAGAVRAATPAALQRVFVRAGAEAAGA